MHLLRVAVLISLTTLLVSPPLFAAQISSQEFLSSDFVTLLKNKKYKEAVNAGDALLKKYPDDPLISRYRAIAFEKLGRPNEAIKIYREILSKDPNDVPARLFLGLAYIKEKKGQAAVRQLRWVIKNSQSKEYQRWAQAQLNRLRLRSTAKPVRKRSFGLVKTGIAYDSNALLIPDNEALSTREQKGSALYTLDVNWGYPLQLKKDFRWDALYIGEQRSHDHGARQVDFTSQGFALDAKKRKLVGARAFLFGTRYDFRANFLRSDLFAIVQRFFASVDTSFWKKTRTHLYARLGISNYGPDGANPDLSSRDGVREGFGITQYFYAADYKTFFFIKGEGNFNQARGENFVREGALARAGLHTPVKCFKKTDLDLSVGYDWGTYPDFTSLSSLDLRDRVDRRLDAYASLTRKWKKGMATRVFYRFIDSENNNDFWDRARHIAGMEMIFSF